MTNPTIAILILAAGGSTRMRLPKQLLPFKRRSLLQLTIDEAAASKAQSVYVILGASAELIQKSLRSSKAQILLNQNWPEGMSSSIRTAINALPDSVDAAIISLCDQPLLTSAIFDKLIDTHSTLQKPIVACEYEGSVLPPVLFSRKCFSHLKSLQGDAGAKSVVLHHQDDVARVSFADGSIDLDTPEDYQTFVENGLRK